MVEVRTKFQTKYSAIIEANRLESFVDDKSLLPVYASSTAKIYPYQIAAARFALRSDYLKGCILCDEASLGKTYEALLVACQKWYEGKENILVILPANLLQQWFRKLEKDFSTVPYVFWNNSKTLPEAEGIVITTYNIAERRADVIKERDWDLVIFDEADILSKPDKILVKTLKDAVRDAYKLLLTPTPITLSIMDIYGLIHFIDESLLPDPNWFYKRYFRRPENYHELTEWVTQFCFRTLKCQTTNYVNFSRRIPITVNYQLSKEEQHIYKMLNAYIISDDKIAYPEIDNYNLSLLLFKALSSSPRACSNIIGEAMNRTYGHEKTVLEEIKTLIDNLYVNSKTAELLKILKTTFNHLKSMKVGQKAIIFVENSLSFDYIYKIFLAHGYNTIKYKDNDSIEQFRADEEIQILIANDEAAKGIDLEFCPVVVNYDLPYDTLKVEQRICRCHRQGQKSDVLVINMLSKENFADVRILELINKRTKQFNEILGMSDDIVGNFDSKIKDVLENFRHKNTVAEDFELNLTKHKEENAELVEHTGNVLFTTFSKSISDKITITPDYIEDRVKEINADLWDVIKYYFTCINPNLYDIDDEKQTLTLQDGLNRPYLFSYNGDRPRQKYEGYRKYSMSSEITSEKNRITLMSVFTKGILSELSMACPDEAKIYVDTEIEPCEIAYYYVDIIASKGNWYHKHILIGQTSSGKVLNDTECRNILFLPVVEIEERDSLEKLRLGELLNDFDGVESLDKQVSADSILKDYFKQKEGSIAYEVEKLKLLAGRKKSGLEAHMKEIKAQIDEFKKKLSNKEMDRLQELEITKQIKVLENDLRRQDNDLFFDMAKIDLDTEKEIAALTDSYNFKVNIVRKFRVQIQTK